MALDPKPGLVIRYDFLWKEEERAGREEGVKDRPCAIVLATRAREDGSREVVLCPITHAPPHAGETAVAIPPKVAGHLGLDDARSWIKTHQVNTVRWEKDRLPYGVTPVRAGQWAYGMLPQQLGRQAFEQVRERSREKTLENVRRDADEMPRWKRAAQKKGDLPVKQPEPQRDRERER